MTNHKKNLAPICPPNFYEFFSDCGGNLRYRQVFETWVSSESGQKKTNVIKLLGSVYPEENLNEEFQGSLVKYAHLLALQIETNWQKCNRTQERFLSKYQEWLDSPLDFPSYVTEKRTENTSTSSGRPLKRFEECSLKTKRRRVENLLKTVPPEELRFAAEASNSKKVFDINENKSTNKCLTTEEALALSFDLDLSDRKYKILRKTVNSLHPDCFPSLYAITNLRRSYLPESIFATEVSAKVKLQDLVNKTMESLSSCINLNEDTSATLVCKWGFDGSGNHSEYKQRFSDVKSTDQYLFLTALVPIKLIDIETGNDLWCNKYPGSTVFCRPIEFTFNKECPELVKEQEEKIRHEIDDLLSYESKVANFKLTTNFQFHFTMVDGSVCNILSETNATTNCFICGAKPTEMNKLSEKTPNDNYYRFGLSSLHSWIRCFECLLHIAYRLPFKTWQVRNPEHKEIYKKEKERIQYEFKSKLGLIVDKPKQSFGSSNDGNTARRFFNNPTLTAEITGLDETLVKKFGTILKVISSTKQINKTRFKELLNETRDLYLNLYRWYYMPSSVHKLLIHGAEIIEYFPIPIGQMTEEAIEATHKVFRKTRLDHTRKTSRTNTCMDLMKRMLLMSDPKIASERNFERRHRKKDKDVDQYLVTCEDDMQFSDGLRDLHIFSDSENSEDSD
jgi:hypothetical protein